MRESIDACISRYLLLYPWYMLCLPIRLICMLDNLNHKGAAQQDSRFIDSMMLIAFRPVTISITIHAGFINTTWDQKSALPERAHATGLQEKGWIIF